MFNSYYGSNLNRKGNTGHQNYFDFDMTFQSYPMSKFTVPKERPYMACYKSLIVTKVVLCTVRELHIGHQNISDL